MDGHEPVSEAGLLFGSVFVAVAIIGISILGGQDGRVQMAASPNSMVANPVAPSTGVNNAPSQQKCLQETEKDAGVETPCVDGCHYIVHGGHFPIKADITSTKPTSDGTKNPGTVQFLQYGATSWTTLTCKGGAGSKLGDAAGQGAFRGLAGLVGSEANSMSVAQANASAAPAAGGTAGGTSGTGANTGGGGTGSAQQTNSGATIPGNTGQSSVSVTPANSGIINQTICYGANGTNCWQEVYYNPSPSSAGGGGTGAAPGTGPSSAYPNPFPKTIPDVPSAPTIIPKALDLVPNSQLEFTNAPTNIPKVGELVPSSQIEFSNAPTAIPKPAELIPNGQLEFTNAPTQVSAGKPVVASAQPQSGGTQAQPSLGNQQPAASAPIPPVAAPVTNTDRVNAETSVYESANGKPAISEQYPFCQVGDTKCQQQTQRCRDRIWGTLAFLC